MNSIVSKIAQVLNIESWQVAKSIELMDNSATIPFISRYRKEATGELNEVVLESIQTLNTKFSELEHRRAYIIEQITQQGSMNDRLLSEITQSQELEQLEDLYLPFKPKRRTRATLAREQGLEPLAKLIMGNNSDSKIDWSADSYLSADVTTSQRAIAMAQDIVAEWVSESATIRSIVRDMFHREGTLVSKAVKSKMSEDSKYRNYYDFSESIRKIAPNRLFAALRGEREGELKVGIVVDTDRVSQRLLGFYSKNNPIGRYKSAAIVDSYKRLIAPSIESEIRKSIKERADDSAIKIFASNLKQLLLAPALGQKRVLALDPGYRTGCKLVCLDSSGDLIHNETIYPHEPRKEWGMAQKKLARLVESYKIEAVAIGDGTASRETEKLLKSIRFSHPVEVYMVSEDGASIYSASAVAREEFPDYDVTVRGAVSIGRRVVDPLAELVKIEPKSLGVGEYQHDVEQSKLKKTLDFVVESCVNSVGVNLNTASYHILTHISGIGATLAKNIVSYRTENGAFRSRKELMKVSRFGAKVFEQSAGFLRITDSVEPLDGSAVHPESYYIVKKIAKDLGVDSSALIANGELLKSIDINRYVDEKCGLITLRDITKELAKPAQDPRKSASVFEFDSDIRTIEDLEIGRVVNGIVTNITSFGAFVDIGIKQDGLVHISQMANSFISSPTEVVALHQHLKVKVIEIDNSRGRVSLSLKDI